jgi:predicted dehydrogenase
MKLKHWKSAPIRRRKFIKGLGAAALGFPTIVSATVLGRSFGHVPPGEVINCAVIGIGGPGSGAVRSFSGNPETRLLAVCDVVDAKLAEAKAVAGQSQRNTECATYTDFRALLDRDDIDVVYVSTPDHWHAIMSIASMKAGKDVYCQKPLTLTIREGREMVKVARCYGRVLQTGSQQRSMSTFYNACTLVAAGRIGKIKRVTAGVGDSSGPCPLPGRSVPDGFDYDMWLGPAPHAPYHPGRVSGSIRDRYHWRLWRDYSGGSMTDFGAHHFDIVQWALGMDHTGPLKVTPPSRECPELTYEYANGVPLVKRYDPFGSVVFHGTDGKIGCSRKGYQSDPPEIVLDGFAPHEETLYRSAGHVRDFLDCVRSRRGPICDVETGHRSATVCHIGNIALWLNRPLEWNPETEKFVNDPEANRLRDRPRRAPWTIA